MDSIQYLFSSLDNSDYIQMATAFLGAFFAFVFFVLGELWISSSKERKKLISEIERMKEYVALQIYFFEQNIRNFENTAQIKPINILLNEFKLFPVEECVYQRIGKFKVTESILKFIVHLRALNEDIKTLNSWIKELSDFSKVAMLEKREDEFSETMKKNTEEFQKKAKVVQEHMQSTQAKVSPLIAELDLTLKYVKSGFWYKWHFLFRVKTNAQYRERQINKLINE